MNEQQLEKALEKLPSNERSSLRRFSTSCKTKVVEMIEDGWKIENFDYSEVEMKKGYHYKKVTSSGSSYTI